MPDLTLFESHTPGRLIAGTGAGLTLGFDGGDCGCCVGVFIRGTPPTERPEFVGSDVMPDFVEPVPTR